MTIQATKRGKKENESKKEIITASLSDLCAKKTPHAFAPFFFCVPPPAPSSPGPLHCIHPRVSLPPSFGSLPLGVSSAGRGRRAGVSQVAYREQVKPWFAHSLTQMRQLSLPCLPPSPLCSVLRRARSGTHEGRKSQRREVQKKKNPQTTREMSCLSLLPRSLLTASAIQAKQPPFLPPSSPPPASTSPPFLPPPLPFLLVLPLGCPSISGY